jgi:hypothetical protein
LTGNDPQLKKFRVIPGGRTEAGKGFKDGFKNEAPGVDGLDPILDIRKKNRLFLAEGYGREQKRLIEMGFTRYPYNNVDSGIDAVSENPDELIGFLDRKIGETQMDMSLWRHNLRKMLMEGKTTERADAAQKLAFIASDPVVYGNDESVKALGDLVKGASKKIAEAREALGSLGLDSDDILRDIGVLAFSLGSTIRRIRRHLSSRLDLALDEIEKSTRLKL